MTSIVKITNFPRRSVLVSIFPEHYGGLGLQHPNFGTTSGIILKTRQCIIYSTQGFFLFNQTHPIAPFPEILVLYKTWDNHAAPLQVFKTFRYYALQLVSLVYDNNTDDEKNMCSLQAASQLVAKLNHPMVMQHHCNAVSNAILYELQEQFPPEVTESLSSILQHNTFDGLVSMSRLNSANHLL